MTIQLHHIVPQGIPESGIQDSEVWGSNLIIDTKNISIVNAKSGKGKTTLISYLTGLRNDFNGRITFDDMSTNEFILEDWIKIRRSKFSTVFQTLDLFENLSAIENIMVKNELCNHQTIGEIESMLERLGITDQKNQLCRTLSMGQKQRVAIIRSLCQPFDCLLLDEPFSHLDAVNTKSAMDLILERIQKENAGMILTSLGPDYELKTATVITL